MARSALKDGILLTQCSHEESQRVLWGINKVAWGARLWLLLSVAEQAAWLPGSYVPWTHPPSHHHPPHPLTHNTCDIPGSVQQPLKN